MKAIINGVRYDTDKAEAIGESSYGNYNDFAHWEATLYVSPRSRRYFLAGSGGPSSMFAHRLDVNSWSGGDGVIPMTRAEAFAWAQEHLPSDTVETHFGDLIEDA